MSFKKGRGNRWWILIPCIFLIAAQGMEYFLRGRGLEFRTMIQIGKGICVWAAAPIFIAAGFCRLFADQSSAKMCRVLFGILVFLILGISYARMGIYLYTGECKREEKTQEGYLICTDYNGSVQEVYEPVYGCLRRPFQGWEEDMLVQKLREQYGAGTDLVRELSEGQYLCTAKSSRTGVQPFYFRIQNDYRLTGNFKFQLMKSDALVFWKTRNRYITFMSDEWKDPLLELSEEAGGIRYAAEERWLNVCCTSEADIPACAADLADWYFYVKEEERYFAQEISGQSREVLDKVHIFGDKTFFLTLDEIFQWMESYSWTEMKEALEEELKVRYEWMSANDVPDSEESGQMPEEAWAEAFLEQYDGKSCEKECAVGDGTVRYRMVCVDAALGSRAYALLKSTDSGASWKVQEMNPFDGQLGMGVDFTFLTEDYGFASLMHNGGDEAELYVTEDGGQSYHLSVFQGVGATLENGYYYQPYDYPQMPYEEDGRLYVLCGQGADGDYAGGDAAGMALFESTDQGYTFLYQGIQKAEE